MGFAHWTAEAQARGAAARLSIAAALAIFATAASAQVTAPADPKMQPMTELTLVVNGAGEVRGAGAPCKVPSGQSSTTCKRLVLTGRPLTLEPFAGPNSSMTTWSGACSGTGRCQLLPRANFSATASFAAAKSVGTATITVAIPVGGGSVKPAAFVSVPLNCSRPIDGAITGACTATVPVGTQLELFAIADAHAKFSGWQSTEAGCQGASCVFGVNQSATLTAKFVVPRFQRMVFSTTGALNSISLTTSTPGATLKCGYVGGGLGGPSAITCQLSGFADGPVVVEAKMPNGSKVYGAGFYISGCKEIVDNRCTIVPSSAPIKVR